ncbi:MAG: hypothetical protein ACKVWV_04120 [Planctomycetota bacterium]
MRDIQRPPSTQGVPFESEVDQSSRGPASCMTADPDGNTILFDPHA